MMASALDSVGDKRRVRTKINENYRFLLLVFTDNFTTKSHLASLVCIRLKVNIGSIWLLIFKGKAHANFTPSVNLLSDMKSTFIS